MPLGFLLDENLRGPLWQAILQHNLRNTPYPLDVVRVGDFPDLPLSSDDAHVLLWAERTGRTLITEDRHTMAGHLRLHLSHGHHSPGILIARSAQPARAMIECLVLIAYAGEPDEFVDSVSYIP